MPHEPDESTTAAASDALAALLALALWLGIGLVLGGAALSTALLVLAGAGLLVGLLCLLLTRGLPGAARHRAFMSMEDAPPPGSDGQ